MRRVISFFTVLLAFTSFAGFGLAAQGGGPGKVQICHKPGKISNILSVSSSAVAAHLAHGDHIVGAEVCDGIDNDCDGVVDEQADASCDDGNLCTTDWCDMGVGCVSDNNAAPCDDGDACTVDDVCGGGNCQPGAPRVCDDANPCTDDACDPASGCFATANSAPCDDGSACTSGDTCSGGGCTPGTPVSCDDGNLCTDDGCDPSTGCFHTPHASPCDDGNACSTGDTCSGGACVAGGPVQCDDGNVCTDDGCDPSSGCTHGPSQGNGGGVEGGNAYSKSVPTERLLAYWSMDQTGGAMLDGSGNGHHGQPMGAPQYGQPSLLPNGVGNAVRLVSTGTRFEVPAFEKWSAGSTGYTLSYWIRINAMPQGGSPFTQAWGDGVSGGSFYMMQYLQRSSGTTACPRPHYGANLGGWDPSPCTVGANLTVGKAHHVVVAWDRPNGQVHVWIDGNKFTLHGKPTGIPTQTNLKLWLGHDNRETQAGWDITLDEVAFWDRPLTDTEVGGQVDAATGPATVPCDDGDACTTEDVCANGQCTGGSPLDCDDGNACTIDACAPIGGCTHVESGTCGGAPAEASLAWWVDASNDSGLGVNSSGVVTNLHDLTGKGVDFVSHNGPTLTSHGDKKAVKLVGSTWGLYNGSRFESTTTNTVRTLIYVGRWDNEHYMWDAGRQPGFYARRWVYYHVDGLTSHIAEARSNNVSTKSFGAYIGTGWNVTLLQFHDTRSQDLTYLFSRFSKDQSMAGEFGEILAYDRVLSECEKKAAYHYLAGKWLGQSLPPVSCN